MQYIKAKVAANIWKVDIMLGMYPMQTDMYKLIGYREMIISFYNKIKKVEYVGIKPSEVRRSLLENSHFIDLIYNNINKIYEVTSKKQTLIFKFNNKLKMDIEDGYKEHVIEIKLPIQDEEF